MPGIFFDFIGHGPSTLGPLASVIMIALAIFIGFTAVAPGTRLGRRRSGGNGQTIPIGSAGRLILLIASVVLLTEGIRGVLH